MNLDREQGGWFAAYLPGEPVRGGREQGSAEHGAQQHRVAVVDHGGAGGLSVRVRHGGHLRSRAGGPARVGDERWAARPGDLVGPVGHGGGRAAGVDPVRSLRAAPDAHWHRGALCGVGARVSRGVGPAVVHGVPLSGGAGHWRLVGDDACLHQRDRAAGEAGPAGGDVPVQHRGGILAAYVSNWLLGGWARTTGGLCSACRRCRRCCI